MKLQFVKAVNVKCVILKAKLFKYILSVFFYRTTKTIMKTNQMQHNFTCKK